MIRARDANFIASSDVNGIPISIQLEFSVPSTQLAFNNIQGLTFDLLYSRGGDSPAQTIGRVSVPSITLQSDTLSSVSASGFLFSSPPSPDQEDAIRGFVSNLFTSPTIHIGLRGNSAGGTAAHTAFNGLTSAVTLSNRVRPFITDLTLSSNADGSPISVGPNAVYPLQITFTNLFQAPLTVRKVNFHVYPGSTSTLMGVVNSDLDGLVVGSGSSASSRVVHILVVCGTDFDAESRSPLTLVGSALMEVNGVQQTIDINYSSVSTSYQIR